MGFQRMPGVYMFRKNLERENLSIMAQNCCWTKIHRERVTTG